MPALNFRAGSSSRVRPLRRRSPSRILAGVALCLASTGVAIPPRSAAAEEAEQVELLSQSLFSSAYRTAVEGNRLYAACGASLLIYDITDRLAPVRLGSFRTEGEMVHGLCVRGTRVYLAAESAGVRIVECADASNPVELGHIENAEGGYAYSVDVQADTAYVADGGAGVLLVDCTTPSEPDPLGACDPDSSFVTDVRVLGRRAYATMELLGFSFLARIDCSDSGDPELIDYVCTGALGAYRLCVTPDSTAYVANGLGVAWGGPFHLRVYDCSDPGVIDEVGRFRSENPTAMGTDVAVQGNHVYFTSGYLSDTVAGGDTWFSNLYIFDRDDPGLLMTPVGDCQTKNFSLGVSVSQSAVYVADEWAGIEVVAASDPEHPRIIRSLDTGGYPQDVAVRGGLAYVAAEGGKLRIVDFTGAGDPEELNPWMTEGPAVAVEIEDDRLYVAQGHDWVQGFPGLTVLDIADGSPSFLGRFEAVADTFHFLDVDVRGGLAYVANGYAGLRILDVSEPSDIEQVSLREVAGRPRGIALEGDRAYVAAQEGGLRIWSVADSTNPVEIGAWTVPDSVFGVAVRNDTAYVACGNDGLALLDCRQPDSLRLLSICPTTQARKVVLSGMSAYVADGAGGLKVIRIARPDQPWQLGFHDTAGGAFGVAVRADTVFVADLTGGLYILRDLSASAVEDRNAVTTGGGLRLLDSFPNPFHASTTIRLWRASTPSGDPAQAPVAVEIFDVAGRRIRSLSGPAAAAEEMLVPWDGEDEVGRRVPPGVYLLRAQSGTESASGRLVLAP